MSAPELERLLEIRGREGVVDDEQRAGGMGGIRGGADVDDVQQRVRRRLDPDDARALVQVRCEVRRDLVRRQIVERVALRLVDLGEHAVHPAVDVVHADEALAGIDEMHDRRRGTEPRGERVAVGRQL